MATLPVPHRNEPIANYNEKTKATEVNDNWHRFADQIASTVEGLGTAANEDIGTSGANVPLLSTANTWSKAQTFDPVVLTFASSLAWDWSLGPIARVVLTGNATLQAPTNLGTKAGVWSIFVYQDAVGSRTLAYDSVYKFPNNGTDPVLSTDPNSLDILSFTYDGMTVAGAASKRHA